MIPKNKSCGLPHLCQPKMPAISTRFLWGNKLLFLIRRWVIFFPHFLLPHFPMIKGNYVNLRSPTWVMPKYLFRSVCVPNSPSRETQKSMHIRIMNIYSLRRKHIGGIARLPRHARTRAIVPILLLQDSFLWPMENWRNVMRYGRRASFLDLLKIRWSHLP